MARLMLAQTGLGSPSELDGAMRRYQMFCENLPDSSPIPTFMEFSGRANKATEVSRILDNDLRGRNFADMDELRRFTEGQIKEMSEAPLEDFEGISSGRMHRILYEDFEQNSDFVEISDELPDVTALQCEIVSTSAWLLRYIAEHGGEVRLTDRGNYPRVLCRSYLEQFDPWWNGKESVPSEASMPFLFTAHDAVVAAGYTVETSSKSMITTEGVVAVTRGTWSKLFTDLLLLTLDESDWQNWQDENLQHTHFAFIQSSALFSLYLLHRHPSGTTGDFYRRFANAFPAYLQPADGNPDLEDLFRLQFEALFFARFCKLFGLVRIKNTNPGDSIQDGDEYEVTELFRVAFKWKK